MKLPCSPQLDGVADALEAAYVDVLLDRVEEGTLLVYTGAELDSADELPDVLLVEDE